MSTDHRFPIKNLTPELEIALKYLGWGDPGSRADRGLWFIGIEEAIAWGGGNASDRALDAIRAEIAKFGEGLGDRHIEQVTHAPEGEKGRPIRQYTTKIIWGVLQNKQGLTQDSYARERLWREGSKILQANLYPLGKPELKSDWPAHYKEIFGLGKDQLAEYVNLVRTIRFPFLYKLWESYSPQATVCFGNTYASDFQLAFRLHDWNRDADPLLINDGKRVILTPHFSSYGKGGMNDKIVEQVIEKLLQWGVRL